jgi:hypothetical protein
MLWLLFRKLLPQVRGLVLMLAHEEPPKLKAIGMH